MKSMVNLAGEYRAPTLAVAAGLLLLALPQTTRAENACPDETGAGACADRSALAEDLLRRRVNRTLAVTPADERFNRLNTPGTSAAIPFDMTPDGSNTNFRTSLSQWSSSLSAADQARAKLRTWCCP